MKSYIEYNGKYYYVSSCFTSDHGYETMIFLCDDKGNVLDWSDLYAEWYETEEEMNAGHERITTHLDEYVGD
jgi:hypothetical protein